MMILVWYGLVMFRHHFLKGDCHLNIERTYDTCPLLKQLPALNGRSAVSNHAVFQLTNWERNNLWGQLVPSEEPGEPPAF